jgi:hypothetical protein
LIKATKTLAALEIFESPGSLECLLEVVLEFVI